MTQTEKAILYGNLENIAAEVLFERKRQVREEGFNLKHDEQHDYGQLARAAAAYAWSGSMDDPHARWLLGRVPGVMAAGLREASAALIERLWPWEWTWWKPKDPRRDMVRAAALLLAAIERLDREALIAPDVEGS